MDYRKTAREIYEHVGKKGKHYFSSSLRYPSPACNCRQ